MAGTCDDVTPAMILATFRSCLFAALRSRPARGFCAWLGCGFGRGFGWCLAGRRFLAEIEPRFAAVALDRTATGQHHLGVVLLGRTGHHRRHMLERVSVGSPQLGGEINVAAKFQHPVVFPLEDGFALLRRQRETIEILGLVLLECLAVLRLHQRHAEHVEMIALARAIRIEHERAGNVVVFFGLFLSRRHRRPSMASDMGALNIALRAFATCERAVPTGLIEARTKIYYRAATSTFTGST